MSSELEAHAEPAGPSPDPTSEWSLRLYVLGNSPQSETAIRNLRRLCETHLSGRYHIEIVDCW